VNGFLLDTNIPSEMTRLQPSTQVQAWLDEVDDSQLYLSEVSLAEILRGIYRLPPNAHREKLLHWLEFTLRPWFQGRILPVTQSIAERIGVLSGLRDAQGLKVPFADGLIAATALEHDLTVVTRNVKDFAGLGATIFNPWE
jgi:predicted nucleic acid-binding protein